jgi:hypothetical protein
VLRQGRRGVPRRGSRIQNRVKQGASAVSDAMASTGEKEDKRRRPASRIRVTTGNWLSAANSATIFTSGGGRLSCGGVGRGGIFPIRLEVACSNFARLQNNTIFAQAAQWRFTGDLIRRYDRRWNQPGKIAVAKTQIATRTDKTHTLTSRPAEPQVTWPPFRP